MRILISAIAGLVFGLGLIISGMSDPAKVQNFLDLFGIWDPSLAFVMAGAIAVTFVGYRAAIGAALFGVGWGLSGFCPGPAIVSLPLLATGTLVFVPAMLVGMLSARALQNKQRGSAGHAEPASR
jgi:uncharacterized protein